MQATTTARRLLSSGAAARRVGGRWRPAVPAHAASLNRPSPTAVFRAFGSSSTGSAAAAGPRHAEMSSAAVAATGAARVAALAAAAGSVFLVLSSSSSLPTLSEGSDTVSDEDLRNEWDAFMIKAIVPGEDDDDDDEDEEDEDEEGEDDEDGDEGVGNGTGGPADETEDPPGSGDAMVLDEDQRDRIDPHEPSASGDGDEEGATAAAGVSAAAAPQGPADIDEDTGPGYEEKKEGEDEEDPYANLPDEDEPTHCTICLINREGPCRRHWRKFERCMKDHGDAKEGESPMAGASSSMAEKCDKYMLPWLTCIQGRRNTYTLITNRFYQDQYVDKLEGNLKDEQRGEGEEFLVGEKLDASNGSLDLSLWTDYVRESLASAAKESGVSDEEVEREMEEARAFLEKAKEEGETPLDTVDDSVNLAAAVTTADSAEPAAAKEEEGEDVEPELVTATATVRLRDPSPPSSSSSGAGDAEGHPIDLAYARDQEGNILGFEQFSDAKKAMRGGDKSDGESSGANGGEEKEEKEKRVEVPTTGKLTFHIQPGKTQSIQIYTIYREDRPDEDEDENDAGKKKGGSKDEKKVEEGAPPRPLTEERMYSSRVLSLFSDEVLAGVEAAAAAAASEEKAEDCGGGNGED